MNKSMRIIITIMCAVITGTAWIIALSAKSSEEKQLELIEKAQLLIDDEIYVPAVPLLEQAAGFDTRHTARAEEALKEAYLAVINKRGYARKYTALLEKQMARRDARPGIFAEAALYQLSVNARQNALAILKNGISRTGDKELEAIYEQERYVFDISRNTFDEVRSIYNRTAQVCRDGRWGMANADGTMLIPCDYDKISTFSQGMAVVKKDGGIFAVDKDNNRIAAVPDGTIDFGNLSSERTAFLSGSGWRRAALSFEPGTNVFEDICMYSGGYAAAKTGGRWGVIDIGSNWLIPPEHDEIITDDLGRCFAQGAVFARDGEAVYLYTGGMPREGNVYQDARPFAGEGYAAVKLNDKWGFIDTEGAVMIDFAFDDALSFSGHLAAVKTGEYWGYINLSGDIVIEAVYRDAISFDSGNAAVLTVKGWQFITLHEYKKEKFLG